MEVFYQIELGLMCGHICLDLWRILSMLLYERLALQCHAYKLSHSSGAFVSEYISGLFQAALEQMGSGLSVAAESPRVKRRYAATALLREPRDTGPRGASSR